MYAFEELDDALELIPLCARRALDRAGRKLSLSAWQALTVDRRQRLAALGSAPAVDLPSVHAQLEGCSAAEVGEQPEPAADGVPAVVRDGLGGSRAIPDATWAALSPLDRYVLLKLASRDRRERLERATDEIVGHSASSPHLDARGEARMIDVGPKPETVRRAVAESRVKLGPEALARLGTAPKGDVLGTARLSAIAAAKRTSDLIPLCHPLRLTHVGVQVELEAATSSVHVVATVEAVDRTGVEMEALTAACVGALTVYDMLKAFDRSLEIGEIRLLEKSGGRSGNYRR